MSTILVVGGDARQDHRLIRGTLVRAVASTRFGGSGRRRAVIAAIRAGGVQTVLLLARWLGHSESRAIASSCRAVGVRCLIVTAGLSAAWAIVEREVDRGLRIPARAAIPQIRVRPAARSGHFVSLHPRR